MHGPRTRDSQNPYRTGVLIGNYTEDQFGQELAAVPKIGTTGITEKQAKHSLNSTQFALMQDAHVPTQQEILVSNSNHSLLLSLG